MSSHGSALHSHAHGPASHTHTVAESYSARAHPEPVVLDIGDDIGALIIHTGAAMHGAEVEISASGQDDRRAHKEVLERDINGRPAFTAVFDKLRQGSYTLWVDDVPRARDVPISGAAVSELDWSGELASSRELASSP